MPLRRLRVPVVVLVALLFHTTVLPDINVDGAHADVMLLLAVAAGLTGGPERGAVMGFVAGMLSGLFVEAPLGLAAFVFSIVGFAVGALQTSIIRSAWWIPVLSSMVASAFGFLLYAFAAAVVGMGHLIEPRLALVAGVGALMNMVLSVGVVPAVSWAFTPDGPAGVRRRAVTR